MKKNTRHEKLEFVFGDDFFFFFFFVKFFCEVYLMYILFCSFILILTFLLLFLATFSSDLMNIKKEISPVEKELKISRKEGNKLIFFFTSFLLFLFFSFTQNREAKKKK
jgi:hypothetical protein